MAQDEAAQYDVRAADTSVKIGGFGFLPQLFAQKFSSMTLDMQQPTFSSIPAEDLTVDLTGVHVPRALLTGQTGTAITVDSTDMRLKLSPAELAELAARATGLGKLHARLTVSGIEADATIRPQVKNGRIVMAVDQLPDGVPAAIRDGMTSLLSKGITLPELPFAASLKQVSVDGGSVVLTATAANLEFAR
jgi:hypothetical protein